MNFLNIFRQKKEPLPEPEINILDNNPDSSTTYTNHFKGQRQRINDGIKKKYLEPALSITANAVNIDTGQAMDSIALDGGSNESLKSSFNLQGQNIPESLLGWYSSQGFIGYTTCAIIAQNWLVDKACNIPARDAIRNGYELTFNDGEEVDPDIIQTIKNLDKVYKINKNMHEFVNFGRVFGIRIAMFKIDFDGDEDREKEFYARPFNIDAVTPGSYKGISQIDPIWTTPELDMQSVSDPGNIHFYDPTWWLISGGMRVHRSHLIIFVNGEVSDILKPSYLYGGVSVPQKIFERVYAAERMANEGPQLALSKRTTILKLDFDIFTANPQQVMEKISEWVLFRDNYGVKLIGENEEVQQIDTSLSDLDAVIMTQYQIVAAASNIPATKLMGTSPKGFNATGEHEIETYNQELQSIQENDLTPLLDRHYLIMMKSDIQPQFDIDSTAEINWNPLNVLSSEQIANINLTKSQTNLNNQQSGAIDGQDIRDSLITDEDSGINGIEVDETDLEIPDIDPVVEGETKKPEPENDKTLQETAMNGAQVTALLDVIGRFKTGEIDKESAIAVIKVAFPVDESQAKAMLGNSNDVPKTETQEN